MTKNDIITYVMKTPHNTNKAVLDSMLNELSTDGGSPTTFTLHIVKGDGISNITFIGCAGTEDGSITNDTFSETADITILPYNGKALLTVSGRPASRDDDVSVDIDGDIEALPNNTYLMTGNATIVLTAETPQS